MNAGRGGVGYEGGGGGGEATIGWGTVKAGRGGVEYEGGGGMSMTGLPASGDRTVGGEKKGLAVLLMMVADCLDVAKDALSGPEVL